MVAAKEKIKINIYCNIKLLEKVENFRYLGSNYLSASVTVICKKSPREHKNILTCYTYLLGWDVQYGDSSL